MDGMGWQIGVVGIELFHGQITREVLEEWKQVVKLWIFNLGGMGCSAGMIATKDMLQVHRNRFDVSPENITQNWYFGNKISMLIRNCFFRFGGAAVLLSNILSDKQTTN
ncbi:unnamed protein product [Ilex paraguariensis]|uniref:FAE domain-containing protein n=1 Tax=Ilex paraguariensis TaxID=185542 RepID=A0ABC8TI53_9AQUA